MIVIGYKFDCKIVKEWFEGDVRLIVGEFQQDCAVDHSLMVIGNMVSTQTHQK